MLVDANKCRGLWVSITDSVDSEHKRSTGTGTDERSLVRQLVCSHLSCMLSSRLSLFVYMRPKFLLLFSSRSRCHGCCGSRRCEKQCLLLLLLLLLFSRPLLASAPAPAPQLGNSHFLLRDPPWRCRPARVARAKALGPGPRA